MAGFRADPEPKVLGKVERAKRVQISTKVDFHTASNFFVGESLNLSEGGLFVATPAPVEVGTPVELRFALPSGRVIDVKGTVRWKRAPDDRHPFVVPGVGIQFTGLEGDAAEEVREFVALREPLRED